MGNKNHKQYKNHSGTSPNNSGPKDHSVGPWVYVWYAEDKEIQAIAREFFEEAYWCFGDSS